MERAGSTFGMATYLHLAVAILVYADLSGRAGDNNLNAGVSKTIYVQVAVVSCHDFKPAIVAYPAQVYVVL